ncbi:MAG: DUF4834 family protein [Bacteroidales bacterium]|nr:DUF4834 family protein [Bacteroidales bacterium]
MKLILTIVLIYLFFKVFSNLFIRILAHKVNKFGMSGETKNEDGENATSKNKKKIIHKNEGDYVDFEELDKK